MRSLEAQLEWAVSASERAERAVKAAAAADVERALRLKAGAAHPAKKNHIRSHSHARAIYFGASLHARRLTLTAASTVSAKFPKQVSSASVSSSARLSPRRC